MIDHMTRRDRERMRRNTPLDSLHAYTDEFGAKLLTDLGFKVEWAGDENEQGELFAA